MRGQAASLSARELSKLRHRQQEEVDALAAIFGSQTIFSCPRPTGLDGQEAGSWDEGLPNARVTVLSGKRGSGELRLRIDMGAADTTKGEEDGGCRRLDLEPGKRLVPCGALRSITVRLPPAYPDFAPPELLELRGPERLMDAAEAARVHDRLLSDAAAFLVLVLDGGSGEVLYQLVEFLHNYESPGNAEARDAGDGPVVDAVAAVVAATAAGGSAPASGGSTALDPSTLPLFLGETLPSAVLPLLDADSLCQALRVCAAWAAHAKNERLFESVCNSVCLGQSSQRLHSLEPRAVPPPALPQPWGSWRSALLGQPRTRSSGLYCIKWAALKPVCRDMHQGLGLSADHINETIIFRYLHFRDDGTLSYLMHSGWDLKPAEVAHIFFPKVSGGGGGKMMPRLARGLFHVGGDGHIFAQCHEAHATVLFRFKLESTHAGANDRLEWHGHAVTDKGAHLMAEAEQAGLQKIEFDVPATKSLMWKFVNMRQLLVGTA